MYTVLFSPGKRHHCNVVIQDQCIPVVAHCIQVDTGGIYQAVSSGTYTFIPFLFVNTVVWYIRYCHC